MKINSWTRWYCLIHTHINTPKQSACGPTTTAVRRVDVHQCQGHEIAPYAAWLWVRVQELITSNNRIIFDSFTQAKLTWNFRVSSEIFLLALMWTGIAGRCLVTIQSRDRQIYVRSHDSVGFCRPRPRSIFRSMLPLRPWWILDTTHYQSLGFCLIVLLKYVFGFLIVNTHGGICKTWNPPMEHLHQVCPWIHPKIHYKKGNTLL